VYFGHFINFLLELLLNEITPDVNATEILQSVLSLQRFVLPVIIDFESEAGLLI
jgi:hypothetical protein